MPPPAPKGYCTTGDVADLMGLTFTEDQEDLCTDLISEIEAAIDRQTGQRWLGGSPITERVPLHYGGYLYLHQRPLEAITAITAMTTPLDSAPLVLPTTAYVVTAPQRGEVYIGGYRGYVLDITYTHGNTVPADITLACTLIVAQLMGRSSSGLNDPNIQRYSIGGELDVVYANTTNSRGWPPQALDLLSQWRRVALA